MVKWMKLQHIYISFSDSNNKECDDVENDDEESENADGVVERNQSDEENEIVDETQQINRNSRKMATHKNLTRTIQSFQTIREEITVSAKEFAPKKSNDDERRNKRAR